MVAKAKGLGLKATPAGESAGAEAATAAAASAVDSAREITDIRQFKAGLFASAGARPVTDLSEFLETDAKL